MLSTYPHKSPSLLHPKNEKSITLFGKHRTPLGTHRTRVGKHRTPLGTHRTRVGKHRTRVGKYRTRVGTPHKNNIAASCLSTRSGDALVVLSPFLWTLINPIGNQYEVLDFLLLRNLYSMCEVIITILDQVNTLCIPV